ncbi:MAG TPA: HIT family protein [Solirubrobacteraceae bacterium]|nr:HIT family protein [Solirubrobacteraceae bacterium]
MSDAQPAARARPDAPRAASCTFCRIVTGELAAHTVLDDDRFLAFLDTTPLFPGHVLLVPKEHHETLWDLPDDLLGPLNERTRRLAEAVRAATGSQGIFTATNNVVSQSVPHLHVHVVPRNRKDGLRGFFWPRTKYASDDDAEAMARRIREATG